MVRKRKQLQNWDEASIRDLRTRLNLTQQELADELGTRQQTISEWETGMYKPRGTSVRMLSFVADRAHFKYEAQQEK
jgi:DNA-binding transcriptional regulator YiaG